jgi:hypothetical protein
MCSGRWVARQTWFPPLLVREYLSIWAAESIARCSESATMYIMTDWMRLSCSLSHSHPYNVREIWLNNRALSWTQLTSIGTTQSLYMCGVRFFLKCIKNVYFTTKYLQLREASSPAPSWGLFSSSPIDGFLLNIPKTGWSYRARSPNNRPYISENFRPCFTLLHTSSYLLPFPYASLSVSLSVSLFGSTAKVAS